MQKASGAGADRDTVALAGCEAHICLLWTALDLLEDEFDVWVVTDACSSRTEPRIQAGGLDGWVDQLAINNVNAALAAPGQRGVVGHDQAGAVMLLVDRLQQRKNLVSALGV